MKPVLLIIFIALGYAFIPVTDKNAVAGVVRIVDSVNANPGFIPVESPFAIRKVVNGSTAVRGTLGFSRMGRPIEVFYFPGLSDKKAMVIGGVHGSELSAIEVARRLIAQLAAGEKRFYSVVVIPCLFPDNANSAITNPGQIGNEFNIGRYSHEDAADPNRQMPALGKAFDIEHPFDYAGRPIERENQVLLQLIQEFKPQRIINLHGIRSEQHAGVYADPRTDSKGIAFDFKSDSSLAVDMARYIEGNGGIAPGNKLDIRPSALYHNDPGVAPEGYMQKRNLHGSKLPGNRGYGVSLGSWAATAVADPAHSEWNRPAIRLFTMEFPGNKRPDDFTGFQGQLQCMHLVNVYADAIAAVFLDDRYVE